MSFKKTNVGFSVSTENILSDYLKTSELKTTIRDVLIISYKVSVDIVDMSVVGNRIYVVYSIVGSGENRILIFIAKHNKNSDYNYDFIIWYPEDNPPYHDCPSKLLKLLGDKEKEICKKWISECIVYRRKLKELDSLPRKSKVEIITNEHIHTFHKGDRIIAEKCIVNNGGVIWSIFNTSGIVKISKRKLIENQFIVTYKPKS